MANSKRMFAVGNRKEGSVRRSVPSASLACHAPAAFCAMDSNPPFHGSARHRSRVRLAPVSLANVIQWCRRLISLPSLHLAASNVYFRRSHAGLS